MKKRASPNQPVSASGLLLLNSSEDLDSTSGASGHVGKSKRIKKHKKSDAQFYKQHATFLEQCNKEAQRLPGQVSGKRLPGKSVPRPPTPPLKKTAEPIVTEPVSEQETSQSDSGPINRKYDKSNFKRGHLIGTKEEVWTGLRYKTSGGLTLRGFDEK
jgi:hypothetical protein